MLLLGIWIACIALAVALWFPLRNRPLTHGIIASSLISPNIAYYPFLGSPLIVMPFLTAVPSHIQAFPGGLLFTLSGIPICFVICMFIVGFTDWLQNERTSNNKDSVDR